LAVLGVLVSMVVMAPPVNAAVADAPTAVTAVGFDRSAAVWFTAPASNGGAAITGYTVTATDSTTSANGGQTCTTTDPSAGCTVAGLTNGDSYTFTVTATNADGASAASTASNAVVPAVVTVSSLGSGGNSLSNCVVLSNGTAQCWGRNNAGQLGDNSTTLRLTPVRVKGVGGVGLLTGVSSIETGNSNTCAVLLTGYVNCWGEGSYGHLGINSTLDSSTPKQVFAVGSTSSASLLSGVASVSLGQDFVCALLRTGGVNCWGQNQVGQTGTNSVVTPQKTPVAVFAVGNTDGTSLLSGVASISLGKSQACALLTTGYVNCWGDNSYGQLGINSTTDSSTPKQVFAVGSTSTASLLSDVASIEADHDQTCALLATGYVNCWGDNGTGQLGINSTTDSLTPKQVFAVGSTSTASLLSGVASIAGGNNFECALLTTGHVNCWGDNSYGQLGINSTTDSSTPKQVFAVRSTSTASLLSGVASIAPTNNGVCALLTTGGVNCWGRNSSGFSTVGDNTTTDRRTPVAVIAAAPTLPTVASGGAGAATVSWTGSLSALTYTVTATNTTTPANGGQTCVTSTVSCTITGLNGGDSYTFDVTSYTGFLTSAASASSSSSTVPTTVPLAPTSLVATPGDGSVSLAFTAGANGGSAITNYKYSTDNGVNWTTRSPAATNSPISITGLSNGTEYTIKLRAVNSIGDGAVSSAVSSTPRTTPAAPTSLVATPGDGSVSIAFAPGADGGVSITKYQYRVGSGPWTDAVGTTSPITVSGLTNYANNSIRLRAVNSAGAGAASAAVSVTPRQEGPAVTAATPSGRTGIVVTFNLNPLPGTTVVYQSVVAYARGTTTVRGTCRTFGRQATCFIGGLTRATNYDLRVTAHLPVPGKAWHNTTAAGSILPVTTNN
jgi:alpha-tubulin suppressor-like RCC1 family protein